MTNRRHRASSVLFMATGLTLAGLLISSYPGAEAADPAETELTTVCVEK